MEDEKWLPTLDREVASKGKRELYKRANSQEPRGVALSNEGRRRYSGKQKIKKREKMTHRRTTDHSAGGPRNAVASSEFSNELIRFSRRSTLAQREEKKKYTCSVKLLLLKNAWRYDDKTFKSLFVRAYLGGKERALVLVWYCSDLRQETRDFGWFLANYHFDLPPGNCELSRFFPCTYSTFKGPIRELFLFFISSLFFQFRFNFDFSLWKSN